MINSAGSGYRTNVIPSILVSLLLIFSAFSAIIAANDNSYNNRHNSLQLAYAQTFGDPIQVTDLPGDQTDPHIASSGDNVYLVMTSEVGGTSNVEFARSTDGGTQFSDLVTISDEGFSFLPDIAAEGDNVYVVWTSVTTQSKILLAKSTNGGLSFDDPVEVTDQPPQGVNARSSTVAVSGDNVYVVWQDFRESTSTLDPEIFFAVSTDGGLTFSEPANISNTPGTLSRNPAIAAYEDNVYVVWTEGAQNGRETRTVFAKSTDGGVDFSTPVELNEPEAALPDVAAYGDNVYVTWSQTIEAGASTTRQVYLVTSTDQGDNFGEPVNISKNPVGIIAQNPNTDADGSNVGVTWELRELGATNSNWDVYFSGSTDNGDIFSSPIDISEGGPSGSLDDTLNDISLSGNNVYVTWTAFKDGSADIYFVSGVLQELSSSPEQIQNLIDTINSYPDISKGTKNSLAGPLRGAIDLLTDDNPNNDNAVCNRLNAFLNQVDSKENNVQISTAQADELREKAQSIQNSLECSRASLSTSSPSDGYLSSPTDTSKNMEKTENSMVNSKNEISSTGTDIGLPLPH